MSITHQEHGDRGFIEDQREFFDKLITQDWQDYHNPVWDKARQFDVEQILRLLGSPPWSILDVGCGCGYHDLIFARHPGVERVVGLDYSPKSIEQANRYFSHPKVERLVADIFSDSGKLAQILGRFDLVASFQVIEHVTRPQEFLAACTEMTATGGYLAVITPNKRRLGNRLRALLGLPVDLCDPLHFTEYSLADLYQMGSQLGADLGKTSRLLKFIACFGRSLTLSCRGICLLGPHLPFNAEMGRMMPDWADSIGIIFQKMD